MSHMRIKIGEHPAAYTARAFLDGQDVSRWCTEADPIEGYVMLYRHDEEGHVLPDETGRRPSVPERHEGRVEIRQVV